MTDNETGINTLAEDYKMVLSEAKAMGCEKIKALYNIPIQNMELIVQALEKQTPKKPVLKSGVSTSFVDYADGTGKAISSPWQDWCCPVCGWFVGQRYNKNQSKPHDQRKSHYCNECGQRIHWGNKG